MPHHNPTAAAGWLSIRPTPTPTARTVQVGIEGVEVARGVLAGVPVKVDLEALGGLEDLLLLLLGPQVLLLDELQLARALALLHPPASVCAQGARPRWQAGPHASVPASARLGNTISHLLRAPVAAFIPLAALPPAPALARLAHPPASPWAQEIVVALEPEETVQGVKRKLEVATGVRAARQKLIGLKLAAGGKAAVDETRVAELALKRGAKVMMMGQAEEQIAALAREAEVAPTVQDDFDLMGEEGMAATLDLR